MTDYRTILEDDLGRVGQARFTFEDVNRRRDRKRRNQRVAAGVVGIAVFITAVWIVRDVASLNRSQAPVVPGGGGAEAPAAPGEGTSGPAETGKSVTGATEAIGPVPETDYLLDLNTGETTPLPKSIADARSNEYAASPDGSRLAYTAPGDDGTSQIFVTNLDGTGIEQVTHDLEPASSPAWSPDGTKIAYIRGGQSGKDLRDVFVLDLATGASTQLTFGTWEPDPAEPDFGPWKYSLPSFTPDGSAIVYNAARGDNIDTGEVEVRMVPVGGGESVLLMRDRSTDGTNAFDAAQLSPDGSLLSYGCGWGAVSICVANADGTAERVLAPLQGDALNGGDWSPDGTRIAYFAFHAQDVSVVDVATDQVTYVAEGSSPTWLDDHTLIVEIPRCYDRAIGAWGPGLGCPA
jgi:dipeptidyl aminopeptidase/acylaminoacyl peptidase